MPHRGSYYPALPEEVLRMDYSPDEARGAHCAHCGQHVHRRVDGFTLLTRASTRVGFSRTKGDLSLLRINPSSQEKQP